MNFTNANFTRVSSGIMRNTPAVLPTGYIIAYGVNPNAIVSQDPSYNNAAYFIGPYARLQNAYLKNSVIMDCDVTGADFTGADFTNVYSARLIPINNISASPAVLPNASYFIKSGYIFGPSVNLSGGILPGSIYPAQSRKCESHQREFHKCEFGPGQYIVRIPCRKHAHQRAHHARRVSRL